ncbi:phosphomannomutase, partial [Achromatium sp. WMS1]
GTELNEEIAYRIGRAYAQFLNAKQIVVGGDIRDSSESLKRALSQGLMDNGTDVLDIGTVGTEEVYFAVVHLGVDGGIEVTASHNPIDYNGMKLVRTGSKPISGDTGLQDIKRLAEENNFLPVDESNKGKYQTLSVLNQYVEHLLSYINPVKLKPIKLVVNSGNGTAGHVIDSLEEQLSSTITFIKIHHEPDSSFPNGIPNPLLPENRADTANAVIKYGADMGIAWDGDFDRCFLFDEQGTFIEGYYIVGLLAETLLRHHQGAKIIHDPRLIWNTIDVVRQAGGIPIQSKTGHAFIKERMRTEDAVYGGEMSAHHYFRDFAYCDSGMIPWLLVTELMATTGKPLSKLVRERVSAYPCSGEINFRVQDVAKTIQQISDHYLATTAATIDTTDGVSINFIDWRFNLRGSNTEPVLRLNVETRGDITLMQNKTAELKDMIKKSSN